MVDGTFYYRNQADAGRAYLAAPGIGTAPPTLATIRQTTGTVREDRRTPERYDLTVTTDHLAYLVIASPAFPGWVATVDGGPARIETIDGALPAIAVPPGTHHVSYAYEPRSVRYGLVLTAVGLVICATALLVAITSRARYRRSRFTQAGG
jgi:uncharacterized membrane protein YfhO